MGQKCFIWHNSATPYQIFKTGSFVWRVAGIIFKLNYLENLDFLRVLDLIKCFGLIRPKTVYIFDISSITDHLIFITNPYFVQEFMVNILQKLNYKILVIWGGCDLITSFWAKGQKWFIWHNSATPYQIFTNNPSFCLKGCRNYI